MLRGLLHRDFGKSPSFQFFRSFRSKRSAFRHFSLLALKNQNKGGSGVHFSLVFFWLLQCISRSHWFSSGFRETRVLTNGLSYISASAETEPNSILETLGPWVGARRRRSRRRTWRWWGTHFLFIICCRFVVDFFVVIVAVVVDLLLLLLSLLLLWISCCCCSCHCFCCWCCCWWCCWCCSPKTLFGGFGFGFVLVFVCLFLFCSRDTQVGVKKQTEEGHDNEEELIYFL